MWFRLIGLIKSDTSGQFTTEVITQYPNPAGGNAPDIEKLQNQNGTYKILT